jgi:hypothetical protein
MDAGDRPSGARSGVREDHAVARRRLSSSTPSGAWLPDDLVRAPPGGEIVEHHALLLFGFGGDDLAARLEHTDPSGETRFSV